MITKIWGCGCGRVVSAVDFGASGPSLMPGDQRKYQILFHFLLRCCSVLGPKPLAGHWVVFDFDEVAKLVHVGNKR